MAARSSLEWRVVVGSAPFGTGRAGRGSRRSGFRRSRLGRSGLRASCTSRSGLSGGRASPRSRSRPRGLSGGPRASCGWSGAGRTSGLSRTAGAGPGRSLRLLILCVLVLVLVLAVLVLAVLVLRLQNVAALIHRLAFLTPSGLRCYLSPSSSCRLGPSLLWLAILFVVALAPRTDCGGEAQRKL